MKQVAFTFKKALLVMLSVIMAFSMVACGDDSSSSSNGGGTSSNPDVYVPPIEISVTASSDTIRKGESVTMTVEVKNATNPAYVWSASVEDLIEISDNVVTVVADVKVDKLVTLTATSVEDPSVSGSKTLTVLAPTVEGQVGELTSDMLIALGNDSITVTGTLTDYYQDFYQSYNSHSTQYDMTVQMEDGIWSGSWNLKPLNEFSDVVVISDTYRRSANDGYTDAYGNSGHALEKLYIDKNNQPASKIVKDYNSVPAVWGAQHLWNHLDNLQITKFSYDVEDEVYRYNVDTSDMDDLYLMTYLSYSLTPMLEDTLVDLYFVIENGEITKMVAQTEYLYSGEYYDENNQVHYDSLSYSIIEITFSNIGTTTVVGPTPYDAPEHADVLVSALAKMKNATNYTFQATDTSTRSPSYDGSDYEMSVGSTKGATAFIGNNVSATGTVGIYGQVTSDAILLATTGKYSYSLDDKLYHTEYSGYKQNSDGTYEEFEYDSKVGALVGTKRIKGTLADALPDFDFSANVFTFVSEKRVNGVPHYTFTLNEGEITRDIAMQTSMHTNADDAQSNAQMELSIVVDANGNLISITYPYDITYGTYVGYITTKFAAVGTTVIEEDAFLGYVPRVIVDSWADYNVMYHPANTLDYQIDALTALSEIYGEDAKDIPNPTVFIDIFGDEISGPFYDDITIGTDTDGNAIKRGQISITTKSNEYDENVKITNYDEIIAQLDAALIDGLGYTKSMANTGVYGSDRYVTYVKNNIQIVVDNNYTRYFWIDFYFAGDWTLKK